MLVILDLAGITGISHGVLFDHLTVLISTFLQFFVPLFECLDNLGVVLDLAL